MDQDAGMDPVSRFAGQPINYNTKNMGKRDFSKNVHRPHKLMKKRPPIKVRPLGSENVGHQVNGHNNHQHQHQLQQQLPQPLNNNHTNNGLPELSNNLNKLSPLASISSTSFVSSSFSSTPPSSRKKKM